MFSRKNVDTSSILAVGTEVFVDVVEKDKDTTGTNFVTVLACIGPRPLQVTIDRYIGLLKLLTAGSTVKYFYDDKSTAVGGILKINSPLETKSNYRILFDRSVAYFCGASLEKANVEKFFRNTSVKFTFDEKFPLEFGNHLVARARKALDGVNTDNLVFFVASYVFIGPGLSEILKRKPVSFSSLRTIDAVIRWWSIILLLLLNLFQLFKDFW